MITKITLTNFKVFSSLELPISPLTVITGINGMGKSSIIQALLLLKQSADLKYLQNENKVELVHDYIDLESAEDLCYNKASKRIISIGMSYSSQDYNWVIDAQDKFKEDILDCKYTGPDQYEKISLFNENFIYLNAERIGPRKEYSKKSFRRINTKLGIQGELAPPFLFHSLSNNLSLKINSLKHVNALSDSFFENVNAWVSEIVYSGTKTRVTEIDEDRVRLSYSFEGTGSSFSALQVGFGFSYILPIIMAGLQAEPGDLLIIENPEAHLHPSAQSKIGYFLAQVANNGVQIIIETHSEHVINGISIACVQNASLVNQSIIYFLEREDNKPSVIKIGISPNGDLDKFPTNFLDQTQQDMSTIYRENKKRTSA